jgi:hypothetical protein
VYEQKVLLRTGNLCEGHGFYRLWKNSDFGVGRGCLAAASIIPGTNIIQSMWALEAPEVRFSISLRLYLLRKGCFVSKPTLVAR